MIAFLAAFFGTLLALLAVGGVGIYLLTVWADDDDLWPGGGT
jgi:hypothetical protein